MRGEQMENRIQSSLTDAQKKALEQMNIDAAKRDVEKVMTILQRFIEQHEQDFVEGKMNIFAVEAMPNQSSQTAQVVFILVNRVGVDVTQITAHLSFDVNDFNFNLGEIDWDIDSEYLGIWKNNHAILLVDEIPFEGYATKSSYTYQDIQLTTTEVHIVEAE